MAYAVNTLNGLIQLNDRNLADIEGVSDLFDSSSFVEKMYAQKASQETLHKYLKQTVAAGAAFRAIGAGVSNAASQDELMTVTLTLLDGSYDVDKALADNYKEGSGVFLTRETMRHLRQAYYTIENQVLNGTIGGSGAGFSGLANSINSVSQATCVNAGGSTALSSVYIVNTMREGLSLIVGNDGRMMVEDPFLARVVDGSSNPYDVWRVSMLGYMGLQLGSTYDAVRIANIGTDAGKGLTDDLIAQAISAFPASKHPNFLVMNRRSLRQLQDSRTATNATGAPAPFPSEAFGIPVVVSDSISNAETAIV